MKLTSAEANKYLKKLKDEQLSLLRLEEEGKTFVAAMGEAPEDARTEYDYSAVQEKLAQLDSQIRSVKHALNVFNVTTVVPGFEMTIDQMYNRFYRSYKPHWQ